MPSLERNTKRCGVSFTEIDSVGIVDELIDELVEPRVHAFIKTPVESQSALDAVLLRATELCNEFEIPTFDEPFCELYEASKPINIANTNLEVTVEQQISSTSNVAYIDLCDLAAPLLVPISTGDRATTTESRDMASTRSSTPLEGELEITAVDTVVKSATPLEPCMHGYSFPGPTWAADRERYERLLADQIAGAVHWRVRERSIREHVVYDATGKRMQSQEELETICRRYPTRHPFTPQNARLRDRVAGANLVAGSISVTRGCWHFSVRTDTHPFCGYCNKAWNNSGCVLTTDNCENTRRPRPVIDITADGQQFDVDREKKDRTAIYDRFQKRTLNSTAKEQIKIWEVRFKTCPAWIVNQDELDMHVQKMALPEYKTWWQANGPRYPVIGERA